MAVNKAFVVKNSLEVNQTLILADSVRGKVGIGTSLPGYLLDVAGGIGATNIYVSGTVYTVGVATFLNRLNVGTNGTTLTGVGGSVGIGTSSPRFLLDIRSPVSTGTTALYAQGDARVTGNLDIGGNATLNALTLSNITVNNQATTQNLTVTGFNTSGYLNITGVATIATLGVTGLTTTQNLNVIGIATIATLGVTGTSTARNLQVIGVSTLGTVQVSSGIVTATAGIVTYYGDGSKLSGVIASGGGSIGIQSGGATVGTAITTINFVGIGLTASQSSNTSNVYLPAPGVSLGLAIALGG
jgi:hypothetical protein